MVQIPRQIFYKLKQEVQFFSSFTDNELLLFLKLMTTESFKAGEVIFKEFDPGDKMFVLVKGQIKIRKRIGKKGGVLQETTLATLHPGECFGEIGLIDNRPRSAAAVCSQDALLFSISLDKLLKIARNPQFAFLSFKLFRNFSLLLATRLRESNQRVVDLTAKFSSGDALQLGESAPAAEPEPAIAPQKPEDEHA